MVLKHLRTLEETEWRDGELVTFFTYADPDDPDNWIDDPCSFCGGESVPHRCIGDGSLHRHGAIHPPRGVEGFWYLCDNPDCRELAKAAWAAYRAGAKEGAA